MRNPSRSVARKRRKIGPTVLVTGGFGLAGVVHVVLDLGSARLDQFDDVVEHAGAHAVTVTPDR